MTHNRIKEVLADRKVSAKELAECVDGCNASIMSYIANGKALPTMECLRAMCDLLECSPADLYDATDVDLLSLFLSRDSATESRKSHELGEWFSDEEVASLQKALLAFGYSGIGEWLREMWRNTLLRYTDCAEGAPVNLSEVILNESQGKQNGGIRRN